MKLVVLQQLTVKRWNGPSEMVRPVRQGSNRSFGGKKRNALQRRVYFARGELFRSANVCRAKRPGTTRRDGVSTYRWAALPSKGESPIQISPSHYPGLSVSNESSLTGLVATILGPRYSRSDHARAFGHIGDDAGSPCPCVSYHDAQATPRYVVPVSIGPPLLCP